MRLSSINNVFFKICEFDRELLKNENRRPYLLILRLIYRGKNQDFAIPFRSNIPSYAPEELYYSLPPRSNTKSGYIHGLHYIKMFPIRRSFLEKFNTDNDKYYKKIINIINTNTNKIIAQSQLYLTNYENGKRADFCTSIDDILLALNEYEITQKVIELSKKEVAASKQNGNQVSKTS